MALLLESAPKVQGVIITTYGDLDILVPEEFREYSAELFENQKRAIDLGAVLKADVDSESKEIIDLERLGWTFERPHCCYHMNIPPVLRENLRAKYPTYVPLSLIQRKGSVVAGIFAVPVNKCFRLSPARLRGDPQIKWPCFKKLSCNPPTNLPLQSNIDQLKKILGNMRGKATLHHIQKEVSHYITILEPHRLNTNPPAWWPQRLNHLGLQNLGKHDLIHAMACILSYNENKVSCDFKIEEAWTTTIREVWKMYQSNGFPENSLQPRHPSTPTTSSIHAPTQPAMTSVREETIRALPPTPVDCSSSIKDVQGDVKSQEEQYYHRESSSTNTPMLASSRSISYRTDTSHDLSHSLHHNFVCIGRSSTSTPLPTILHEQNAPKSKEEDTSAFSETQQNRQYVQEGMTAPSNMEEVNNIIYDMQSDHLLGYEEHLNRSYPKNYECQDPAKSHWHCFKSIEQSPRMNLSLRSNQSESVRAAVENVEPDTNKPEDYAFDEPTKIFFVPKHVSTNFSKPSTGMRFDLGDTEQLKVFYTTRLELISKSVLERITSCWHKRKRLRCISTLGEEKESRASLRKLTKDAIISQAVSLLLLGEATGHEEYSWIKDLEEHTTPTVEKISTSQFSTNVEVKEFVQKTVLPGLFHVAQLYEIFCQPMSKQGPSKYRIVIEWTLYCMPRKQKVTREETADSEVPQSKRQRVHPTRTPSNAQYESTIHGASDSPTPIHSPTTFEHSQAAANAQVGGLIHAPLPGLDTMKKVIDGRHSGLNTADMLEALNMYMSSLEVILVPGPAPFWWPPGLNHEEYINFGREDLISVIAYLLLHHKFRFRDDLRDSKPWTARFQQRIIPTYTSQVTVPHHLRTLTKENSSDTSFAPPQSTMPTISECSSSAVNSEPLPLDASSKDVLKRLGIDETSPIRFLLLEDAKKARDSLSLDPNALPPSARDFPTTQKPYQWVDISATARYNKTLEMVDNATADLAPFYKVGEYKTKVGRENWLAIWSLRRSFRHRDNRSKKDITMSETSRSTSSSIQP